MDINIKASSYITNICYTKNDIVSLSMQTDACTYISNKTKYLISLDM